MFGWFRPSCPVNPCEKAWTERRTAWLVEQFGLDRLRQTVPVLPTPEFFPDPYAGTDEDVRTLLDRVCGYMGVAPGRVDLDFFDRDADGIEDAAGLYVPGERETIRIERGQLDDPMALVGTLAHELGHVLLLGDGRLAPEESDHEWVTDLVTVFLGMGLFPSNSAIRESYEQMTTYFRWTIHRRGYLSERVYGYALSLFAWARDETDPAWARYLRPNVREPFRHGLRYLTRTGDSLFQPDRVTERPEDPGRRRAGLIEALRSASTGARIGALWDLAALGLDALPASPELIGLLGDADPYVRAETAATLAGLGPAALAAVPALVDRALLDDTTGVRAEAVAALGAIGERPDVAVPALVALLRDGEPAVQSQARRALPSFGAAARDAVPVLVATLDACEEEVAEEVIQTLGALGAAATEAVPAVRAVLRGPDHALHAGARQALRAIRGRSHGAEPE